MILTSPAARGLLRAIVEDPTDDVPRLLLADVLEELGDPRGEFIRVQVKLARLDATGYATADAEKIHALRRRERELLREHSARWLCAAPPLNLILRGGGKPDELLFHPIFRRGFVASVTLTLADWHGKACNRKRHDRGIYFDCPDCHGTGRTGGHGPALVLAAPIEEVILHDAPEPRPSNHARSGFRWYPEQMPVDIYRLIQIETDSLDEARSAYSRAALAWARQEAGLPALTRGRQ